MSSEEKEHTGIDLGLSKLLESHALVKDPQPKEPLEAILEDSDAESEDDNIGELALLAKRSLWKELQALCERRLGRSEQDLEARAWWIKAQIETKAMPLSILEAPYHSLKSTLEDPKNDFVGKDEASQLKSILAELEIYFVKDKTSNKEADEIKPIKSDEVKTKALNEADFKNENKTKAIVNSESLEREKLRSTLAIGKGSVQDSLQVKQKTHYGKLALLLTLLATAIVFYFLPPSETTLAKIAFQANFKNPSVNLPLSERSKGVSNLAALSYAIDDTEGSGTQENLPADGENNARYEHKEEEAISAPRVENRGPRKERIDMSGPREGHMAGEFLENDKAVEEDSSVPLRPQSLLNREAKSSGYSSTIENGSFREPRAYEVLAETMVLSRPSLAGMPLNRLLPGDQIKAEGIVGTWLRIRSRNGAPGYILLQDAEPR